MDSNLGTSQTAVVRATTSDQTGIYRGRQTEPSFTPSLPLIPGLEYFWRIDEVNEADSISRGIVWRFVLRD
jgi:hypothetical protein